MPAVSIIIPIYNVSLYLENCLNSVLNQTYSNFEVMMVNDGSTDDSPQIAQKFVAKDHRFQLIHQANGGLSAARNTGLKHATGDFIFYLDSDDYLKKDCLEKLVQAQKEYNADVIQANFYYDYPDYLLYGNWLKGKNRIINQEESIILLLEQKEIKNFAWGKLIRSSIAQKHLFPEGKYFEDTLWMYLILKEVKIYVLVAEPLLYYLQRETGISGNFSIRNLDQLELEVERLKALEKDFSYLYPKALKQFNQKVIQHTNLLKYLPIEEQQQYKKTLNDYKTNYQLRTHFAWDYRKEENQYLKLGYKIKNKLISLMLGDDWIKRRKHE